MKTFIAKLVSISLVLTLFWIIAGRYLYPSIIGPVARPFFEVCRVKEWYLALVIDHFANVIPYISITLSMPLQAADILRVSRNLVVGISMLVVGHLVLSILVYHIVATHGLGREAFRWLVPAYLMNDVLPIVPLAILYSSHIREYIMDYRMSQKSNC